ncbi:hypothetical protein EW146_g1332 [Bondarzewia mesenterica]|uniref:Uncharacterized protein n=1 Tax=Bondarzewia mesenterica TaxID=1095465 RepID=A0A4S4M5Y1_9AGAM|nr:hypothetical protein EW146_g1332 [Bondarzewia mesenterica]
MSSDQDSTPTASDSPNIGSSVHIRGRYRSIASDPFSLKPHPLLGVTLVLDQPLKSKLTIELILNGKLWHEESFDRGLIDFKCELDNVLTLQSGSDLSILYTRKYKLGIRVPVAKASILFRDAQQLIANGTGKSSSC